MNTAFQMQRKIRLIEITLGRLWKVGRYSLKSLKNPAKVGANTLDVVGGRNLPIEIIQRKTDHQQFQKQEQSGLQIIFFKVCEGEVVLDYEQSRKVYYVK